MPGRRTGGAASYPGPGRIMRAARAALLSAEFPPNGKIIPRDRFRASRVAERRASTWRKLRLVAAAAGSLGRNARAAAMSQQLVQLELDEKDKENFSELQQSMSQAQQELGRINGKLQLREREKRHAQFTLAELNEMDNSTRAYRQVGKMFLADDMPNLKDSLGQKIVACDKEVRTRRRPRADHTSPHPPTTTRAPQVTALSEKRSHVEEALKKVRRGPLGPPAAAAAHATLGCIPLRCKRISKSSSRRTLSRWRRTRASERVWGRCRAAGYGCARTRPGCRHRRTCS